MKSLDLPEKEFISLFRLNKQLTVKLIELLRPALEPKDCRRNVTSSTILKKGYFLLYKVYVIRYPGYPENNSLTTKKSLLQSLLQSNSLTSKKSNSSG